MRKKILIIGNSAREYALAKYLSKEYDVFVAPGTSVMKSFATCVDIRPDNINELLDFVMENNIDMTIPISELSIQSDISARFGEHKLSVFAPSARAIGMLSNKVIAKRTLYKLRIPTPKFGVFEKANIALDYIKNQKVPFVIKSNDSNSSVICTSVKQAKDYIDRFFIEKNKKIIIEDYVYGTPFSFYTVTDGYKALPFGSSLIYKHSLEGNGGQLTGGMGACTPNYKLSYEHIYELMDNIIYPTLENLERDGNPYLGILGINGIITEDDELVILGYNSFMQDCDCAAVLNSLNENIYSLFDSCIIGSFSDEVEDIEFKDNYSVTVVAKCFNKVNENNAVHGLESLDEDTMLTLYPSAYINKYMELCVQNGLSLALTSSASSVAKARQKVYSELQEIDFSGIQYRNDICKMHA